jgi:uncharacterized protein YjbJ (UPF0337 family)
MTLASNGSSILEMPGRGRFTAGADVQSRRSTFMEEKKDKLSGQFEEGKGNIKEEVGDLRGDESQKTEGQMDQVTGKVKQGVADAKEKIGDLLDGDDKK